MNFEFYWLFSSKTVSMSLNNSFKIELSIGPISPLFYRKPKWKTSLKYSLSQSSFNAAQNKERKTH